VLSAEVTETIMVLAKGPGLTIVPCMCSSMHVSTPAKKTDALDNWCLRCILHIHWTDFDRERNRKARNTTSKAIETEYHKCLNNVIGDVTTDPRSFYRFIKSKHTEPVGISTLKSGDNVFFNNNDKVDCLNGYFASVFTVEDLSCCLPSLTSTYPDMPDITITEPGVLKLLLMLDPNKSLGPDNIPPRVLKEVSSEIAPILISIFNQSISCGTIPDDWRLADIFPLHKKGPKDLPENYRPISLTFIWSISGIKYDSITSPTRFQSWPSL